jgi:hypothetical protein
MKQIIATYIRTTSGGANWYSVPTGALSAELLEYFAGKAERSPEYCKITEETVQWCTQFEWADQLSISAVISKSSGQLCLKTEPILTAEQRREAAQKLAKVKPQAAAATAVDTEPEF